MSDRGTACASADKTLYVRCASHRLGEEHMECQRSLNTGTSAVLFDAPPLGACWKMRTSPRQFRARSSAVSASGGTLAAAASSFCSSMNGTCSQAVSQQCTLYAFL